MRRVAALGAAVEDLKTTGVVKSHKATMLRAMPSVPSEPVAMAAKCFHHFERDAVDSCHSCSRSFCPACLDENGMCSHCAQFLAESEGPAVEPELAASVPEEPAPAPARSAARGPRSRSPQDALVRGNQPSMPSGGAPELSAAAEEEAPAPKSNWLMIGLMAVVVVAFLVFLSVLADSQRPGAGAAAGPVRLA